MWGINPAMRAYIDANSALRIPEGTEECLKRMTITAMIAGDAGLDAAAPTLINGVTSATLAGEGGKKEIQKATRSS